MSATVQLTLKSSNRKVGAIPVSTSDNSTCPDACPLKRNGCYADGGPLGILWGALSRAAAQGALTAPAARGATYRFLDWQSFCDTIESLPDGQLWRHNQAGDLPGHGDAIDLQALAALVLANDGKRGFTYTHKPLDGPHGDANAAAIANANANGFTVNLSADNLAEADTLSNADIGPVVVVLSHEVEGKQDITTPEGRKVAVCPATYRDDTSCASCGLCQRQDRKVIVGFPAHGASKRKATAVAVS